MDSVENIINDLLERMAGRLEAIEYEYLRQAGETLKWIMSQQQGSPAEFMGFLTTQEYQERIMADLQKIQHYLSGAVSVGMGDLESTSKRLVATIHDMGQEWATLKNRSISPAAAYHVMITPLVRKTMRDYSIMAKSTAVSTHYKNTIRGFVERIARGGPEATTGPAAMRAAVTELSDQGISIVHYAGKGKQPYSRRLDSSVRVAISGEYSQIVDQIQTRLGEEVGFDAREITVETACAYDHLTVQGKVFDLENWELLQAGEVATDTEGETHLLDKRAIGQFNCRHIGMNFMLGVSEPSYSREELDRVNNRNKEGIEFDGEKMSLYSATQWQRRNETEQRRVRGAREVLYPFRNDPQFKAEYKEYGARIKALDTSYKRMGQALEPHAIIMKPGRKYNINARGNR